MEHQVARLSEGQRECLRMVYRHMETKEIARILGISPDGVTQRIKTAMRILGVQRRRDAALILAKHEGTRALPAIGIPATGHCHRPRIRRHLPQRLRAGGQAGLQARR